MGTHGTPIQGTINTFKCQVHNTAAEAASYPPWGSLAAGSIDFACLLLCALTLVHTVK